MPLGSYGQAMDAGLESSSPLRALLPAAVVVAGESEATRRRASAVLRRQGFAVRGHRSTVDEFLAANDSADVDVVVLCYERFGTKDAAEVGKLKEAMPEARIVVAAKSATHAAVVGALSSGLDGCVLEHLLDDCLALAIVSALRGQLSLPHELSAAVSRPVLSVREKQILALVVMGFSNAEIAATLFVSESTVKSHLSSAFGRLGVRSRHEAAARILDPENGLGAGILTISGDERRRGRG